MVELNNYNYKTLLTERWLSGWKHRSWNSKYALPLYNDTHTNQAIAYFFNFIFYKNRIVIRSPKLKTRTKLQRRIKHFCLQWFYKFQKHHSLRESTYLISNYFQLYRNILKPQNLDHQLFLFDTDPLPHKICT